ncbi:MAG TPA: aldolase/citrate lyase family protein [Flavitalea sp.]|nr:aldolase/citrate lyase family protein [Flavitalea sp.]
MNTEDQHKMKLKSSRVRKILKEGGTCFGTMLRILRSPHAVALCASQNWDYIILDTEHNDYDLETISNFALAAKYEDLDLYVRPPDKLYHQMAQMLDVGAEGLILPQVKTVEEVQKIINATKYAPIGKRGVSISETVTRYRDYNQEEYTEWANGEIMTIIQIESEEGVNNAGKLVSQKGVDAVMIGPADLSQDLGIPGQLEHPRMEEAFREVILQCNNHGVAPGIHFSNIDYMEKWVKEGMRFNTYSYDSKFLKDAYGECLLKLRQMPSCEGGRRTK